MLRAVAASILSFASISLLAESFKQHEVVVHENFTIVFTEIYNWNMVSAMESDQCVRFVIVLHSIHFLSRFHSEFIYSYMLYVYQLTPPPPHHASSPRPLSSWPFDRYLISCWECWNTMHRMVRCIWIMKYKFLFLVSLSNQFGVPAKSIVLESKTSILPLCTISNPCLCRR